MCDFMNRAWIIPADNLDINPLRQKVIQGLRCLQPDGITQQNQSDHCIVLGRLLFHSFLAVCQYQHPVSKTGLFINFSLQLCIFTAVDKFIGTHDIGSAIFKAYGTQLSCTGEGKGM